MEQAVLIGLQDENEIIYLKGSEFSLGRGLQNSYVCRDLTVSRCHCTFRFENNKWTVLDNSSNGTMLNSKPISKDSSQPMENNDILELNDAIKYRFHYPYNASKKRRVENNNSPENPPSSKEIRVVTVVDDNIVDNSNIFEVHKLKTELSREKAIIKKLKDDSKEMQTKIFELEVDLFNKISSSVKLEQEIIALKSNCADLQKEKDELQIQLVNCESETNLLRHRLENSQASKIQTANSDDEDEKMVQCLELYEKEICIKTKIANTLSLLKKLDDKGAADAIQKSLSEIKSEIEDLTKQSDIANSRPSGSEFGCIREELFKIMETDLQCSICNEVFIKATLLNCGHTFCKLCIEQWRKQKNTCPVCRVNIKTLLPCLAIDNYVDQTIELLSPSKKNLRIKLKETHEASTSTSAINVQENPANRFQTVYISSDSDSDTDEWDTEDFSDFSDGNYYGGYGACFICGAADHWANSCPQRRGGGSVRPRRR